MLQIIEIGTANLFAFVHLAHLATLAVGRDDFVSDHDKNYTNITVQ